MSLDEARHFLKELAIFSHLEYDEVDGDALLEQCDENNDGWITLKEFQHLFFASTRHLQISMTELKSLLTRYRLIEIIENFTEEDPARAWPPSFGNAIDAPCPHNHSHKGIVAKGAGDRYDVPYADLSINDKGICPPNCC